MDTGVEDNKTGVLCSNKFNDLQRSSGEITSGSVQLARLGLN